MAQQAAQLRDMICCSICLDFLKDPREQLKKKKTELQTDPKLICNNLHDDRPRGLDRDVHSSQVDVLLSQQPKPTIRSAFSKYSRELTLDETEVSRVKEIQEKLEQEMKLLKKREEQEMRSLTNHPSLQHESEHLLPPNLSETTHSPSLDKTEVSRVKEIQEKLERETKLLKKLEQEMADGNKKATLTNTEVHDFLPQPPLQPQPDLTTRSDLLKYSRELTLDPKTAHLQLLLTDRNGETLTNTEVQDFLQPQPQPEPKTRSDFLKYSRELTLDPQTAHLQLVLTDRNKKATLMSRNQSKPSPNPNSNPNERFTGYYQALSEQNLSGRCYWEVEWRGLGVHVAVAYKDISRGGHLDTHRFGCNDKSWALRCHTSGFKFWHDKVETKVPGRPLTRIGVYVDHSAGVLSFYSVCPMDKNTMTLIHTVTQTTFTQPLYAGVELHYRWEDFVKFC